MLVRQIRFLGIAILMMVLIFPNMPAAALGQSNVLSNGQFVYGPNIGSFDLKAYLTTHAPHLSKYADDLYGRAEYNSINPKVYLTLLEIHAQLITTENSVALNNALGLGKGDFMTQVDAISTTMTKAYYEHLYNYSALPLTERNMPPFTRPSGGTVTAAADTNAGTYAVIAALATMDQQNIPSLLDNSQTDGFYQTYQKLFENDNPLDEANQIDIPGQVGILSTPPSTLLQLPYMRGLSWKFGGVHDTSGCSGLGSNGCQFTDASAIDMYPIGSTWGIDTSSMWIVAAAAGTPTRISACQYKIAYADGWETDYYHLENTITYSGTIQQNDKIGVIANTEAEATCNGGSASGPHVHFWLRHNGANVALNGTTLSGWTVHTGRWSYDTDPAYMWLARAGVKKYAFSDTILSESPLLTFKTTSIDTLDGWVLESAENSNLGGGKNSADPTFRVGDNASRKQFVGILAFNTSALPDTAVISTVTLKIRQYGIVGGGDPVTAFQGFLVAFKNGTFGTSALQTTDFNAAPSHTAYGAFSPTLVNNFYTINVTNAKAYINKLATNDGLTQIRLRLKLDDNNDAIANYLQLYSGNTASAYRPQLIITYTIP